MATALGSQAATVEAMTALTGLTHDIFVGKVIPNVHRESKVAMLFQEAQQGEYRMEGQNMVFATDLRYVTGALATDGKIPDHVGMDAVQGKLNPIRRYRRMAIDNLVELQASGPGAFEDLGVRILDLLWDSWKSMEIRHSIGASSGVLCKVTARTSSTVFTVEDGYNHDGTNPLLHLSEGSIIGWYDVSASQVGGAAKITATGINYSTPTITVDSATTWETTVGNQIAAGDFIYFASTNSTANGNFVLERNLAPSGAGTILDPDAAATTVYNISQTTYQRWKPYRVASTSFDHLEVKEHWLKLGEKRKVDVTPQTDVAVAHPGAIAQLARTMMGFQQQIYTGGNLEGGYDQVIVGGVPFAQDGNWYHDVIGTFYRPGLFRVMLGGEADFFAGDGSQWSRIADFDGKDAYVGDYMNLFCPQRGFNGALTSIVTPDVTDSDFDPLPSY